MENITLGQISNILLFIVEFVGVVTAVIVTMKKVLNKQLSPLNKKIDKLDENQKNLHRVVLERFLPCLQKLFYPFRE
mgnify:CR=1 FL=1